MLGDGLIHGRPVSSNQSSPLPVLDRHDGQVGADVVLAVEQPRQLPHRHAVADRHREVADEAELRLVEHRALDLKPVDRVRPVEHDDRHLPLRRLLHGIGHRRHVGVEARADVLEIDDERVDAVEHRRRRPAAVAVERVDRQAGLGVGFGRHVGVEHAADAVLGAEQRDQLDVLGVVQQVDRGRAVPRAAGVVRDEADALALRAARSPATRRTSRPVMTGSRAAPVAARAGRPEIPSGPRG